MAAQKRTHMSLPPSDGLDISGPEKAVKEWEKIGEGHRGLNELSSEDREQGRVLYNQRRETPGTAVQEFAPISTYFVIMHGQHLISIENLTPEDQAKIHRTYLHQLTEAQRQRLRADGFSDNQRDNQASLRPGDIVYVFLLEPLGDARIPVWDPRRVSTTVGEFILKPYRAIVHHLGQYQWYGNLIETRGDRGVMGLPQQGRGLYHDIDDQYTHRTGPQTHHVFKTSGLLQLKDTSFVNMGYKTFTYKQPIQHAGTRLSRKDFRRYRDQVRYESNRDAFPRDMEPAAMINEAGFNSERMHSTGVHTNRNDVGTNRLLEGIQRSATRPPQRAGTRPELSATNQTPLGNNRGQISKPSNKQDPQLSPGEKPLPNLDDPDTQLKSPAVNVERLTTGGLSSTVRSRKRADSAHDVGAEVDQDHLSKRQCMDDPNEFCNPRAPAQASRARDNILSAQDGVNGSEMPVVALPGKTGATAAIAKLSHTTEERTLLFTISRSKCHALKMAELLSEQSNVRNMSPEEPKDMLAKSETPVEGENGMNVDKSGAPGKAKQSSSAQNASANASTEGIISIAKDISRRYFSDKETALAIQNLMQNLPKMNYNEAQSVYQAILKAEREKRREAYLACEWSDDESKNRRSLQPSFIVYLYTPEPCGDFEPEKWTHEWIQTPMGNYMMKLHRIVVHRTQQDRWWGNIIEEISVEELNDLSAYERSAYHKIIDAKTGSALQAGENDSSVAFQTDGPLTLNDRFFLNLSCRSFSYGEMIQNTGTRMLPAHFQHFWDKAQSVTSGVDYEEYDYEEHDYEEYGYEDYGIQAEDLGFARGADGSLLLSVGKTAEMSIPTDALKTETQCEDLALREKKKELSASIEE
ncbi:unnamed protein product [Zymoseptoria tritici ST99CH_3D7]|uniref:Uncharacterized protein n=1 Tax=Zymoseptoria tritici (strain ST99CH_3D7) TaxID=1276538 RepID=A0A1X7RC07_ZYMT9|nr:unnamed protein product [Zymoseptoria tritici ST99CH_3D7]